MESELMLSILSGLAEGESASIAENNKWSIQKRFQNGTYKIGCSPYGYNAVNGELVINEQQAEIVRLIFSEALSGKGTHKIAKELNAKGLKGKNGGRWTSSTIRGMIGNEKYIGDAIFQKTYSDSQFNRHKNDGEKEQYLIREHHEAIISHDDFEAAQMVTEQRGKEKGLEKYNKKYLNRYPFSGKIICSQCGGTFKRRTHSSGSKYIAWCCSTHIESIEKCSMKYVLDSDFEYAFVTMMNKLIFSHQTVLKPLLIGLRGVNTDDSLMSIQDIDKKLAENAEQQAVLVNLMTKDYLDRVVYKKSSNNLLQEAERLQRQKESINRLLQSGNQHLGEVSTLLQYATKATMLKRFDEDVFNSFVKRIVVYSRTEIGFELRCGITLKERLVKWMSHTPFGYRIRNGIAVIDKLAAEQLTTLFQSYLAGDSLATAAQKAGILTSHAAIGKMLRNTRYLGDDYYPAIIDSITFEATETERIRRAEKLGRVFESKEKNVVVYPTTFRIKDGVERFDDPFQQAEYAYSLIESEV